MEPVLSESGRPPDQAGWELLESRLAMYFRSLGVKDESAVRRAVQHVRDRLAEVQPNEQDEVELVRAGMSEAMACVHAWMEQASSRPTRHTDESPALDSGVLLWRLRPLLSAKPGLLFRASAQGDEVDVTDRIAQPRVVPPELTADMPTQPLDDLPEILRLTFWRQVRRTWSRIWSSATGLLTGQRERA